MNEQNKPNIILIMTDQQRVDTIRALGHEHMVTPNMDLLMQRGVCFQRAFTCGATCVPARASIFTGMYPHNTGVHCFNRWAHHRSWIHNLAEGGYHCVNIGKMHVIPRDEPMGFHERLIVENPTSNFLGNGGQDDDWGKYLSFHDQDRPFDRHLTDPEWSAKCQGVAWHLEEHLHPDVFVGNASLAWIRRHRPNKPVFLQIGFTGPHEPYDPLPRHLELYKDKTIPRPQFKEGELAEKPPQHRAHQDFNERTNHESQIQVRTASEEQLLEMRRHYYAKVTTVDEKIGEILQALEEKGYLENAVIIFTSDHGDMLGDHRLPYKWLMYDSVVHVPLVIWDTRGSSSGVSRDLVSLIDLGPTILDAAGLSIPKYLEGQSLMDYVRGGPVNPQQYVFCEDNYLTMIRSDMFKLINYTGQEDNGELYDLTQDPYELNNLFNKPEYASVQFELNEALFHWLLQSTYNTSVYKNKEMNTNILLPRETPYLHHKLTWNPHGWAVKSDTK